MIFVYTRIISKDNKMQSAIIRLADLIIDTLIHYPGPMMPLSLLRMSLPAASREQVDTALYVLHTQQKVVMIPVNEETKLSQSTLSSCVQCLNTKQIFVSVKIASICR